MFMQFCLLILIFFFQGEFKNPSILSSGFDRARIYTITRLTKTTIYGFALSIINAPTYAETQHTEWRISTYTKYNSAVDGSVSTVAWNPRDAYGSLGVKSWGIFKHQLTSSDFSVDVADLRPYYYLFFFKKCE